MFHIYKHLCDTSAHKLSYIVKQLSVQITGIGSTGKSSTSTPLLLAYSYKTKQLP